MMYGSPNDHRIKSMFEKIKHRGPDIHHIYIGDKAMMAQNYLPADIDGNTVDNGAIPYHLPNNPSLRICYDGLIGNREELAEHHGIEQSAFTEEHLLLTLYEKYGREMLTFLDDAIYAFVICDQDQFFAARDPLGIKTLFYGKDDDGTLYLSSELKSVVAVTSEVYEFLPGHHMNETGKLVQFQTLTENPPAEFDHDVEQLTGTIFDIIEQSVYQRLPKGVKVGGLLSGGIDSSVINYLAIDILKKTHGENGPFKTFALGVGESQDIQNARIMADFLRSEHHELLVDLDQMMEVLPDVIYYLESFDPSLVRSSVSNYLISGYAKNEGVDVLLSGEGGDEIFCGYIYLKQFPLDQLFSRQMQCLKFLHNNASLRLDRMNQANGIRVVAPLISGKLLNYAMQIPARYKQKPEGNEKIEKWIFRKAFESKLPDRIVWRLKQEFSQGSGSADVLPSYFEDAVTNDEFSAAKEKYPLIRSKEEFYYFRIFTDFFGDKKAVDTVGQWVNL